jgi:hypothetical protein
MADYTKGTGSGGTMLIRDLGLQVQFHLKSGSSATWVGSPGFGTNAYVDGAWRGLPNLANVSGNPWVHLGSHNANYTQDVCFHIDYSGTSGYGGPTDFWQNIYRAPAYTAPPPPTMHGFTTVGHTDATVQFSSTGTGNGTINGWQLAYGLTTNINDATVIASSGTSFLTGLKQGATYYAWARGSNVEVGWGGWSTMATGKLISGAWVKVAGVWVEAVPMVKVAGVWIDAIPCIKKNGTWESGR